MFDEDFKASPHMAFWILDFPEEDLLSPPEDVQKILDEATAGITEYDRKDPLAILVMEHLAKVDPDGFIAMSAPRDEYKPEAVTLTAIARNGTLTPQVVWAVWKYFLLSDISETCDQICAEILSLKEVIG